MWKGPASGSRVTGFSPHSVSNTWCPHTHTHTYLTLFQVFTLPGSLQYELAEMYSCCQVLCALNKTQQQPNVVIFGWSKNKKTCVQREMSVKVCELLHRTDYRGLKGPVCCVCSQYAYVSRMSPEGKKFCVEWWLRVEALYIIFILFYYDYFFSIIPWREIMARLTRKWSSNFLMP